MAGKRDGANAPVRSADEIASTIFLWSAIVGGILGLIGYVLRCRVWTEPTLVNGLLDLSDTLFKTFRLFSFSADIPSDFGGGWREQTSVALLHIARYLAPVSLYGTLLRVLLKLTAPHRQRSRLGRMSGHTVICGLGETGRHFLNDLLRRDSEGRKRCVVIESRNLDAVRAFCRQLGVELVEGDARQAAVLALAGLLRARRLLIVPDDESMGLEIAAGLPDLLEARSDVAPLKAHLQLRDDALLKELTDRDAFVRPSARLELRPFNVAALIARRFFADHNLMEEAHIQDQSRVHLVFVGFDEIALQLLLQLARICPFRALTRPLVTILAPDAERCRQALRASYPELIAEGAEAILDLRLVSWPVQPGMLSLDLMAQIEGEAELTGIVVALGEDALNARTALMLRTLSQREARWRAPIHVSQTGAQKFGRLAHSSGDAKRWVDLIAPFGTLEETCHWAEIEGAGDEIAEALHTGYLALQGRDAAYGPRRPGELDWAVLSETFRRANRRAADHVAVKLASAGFHSAGALLTVAAPLDLTEAEITDLARLEHQSWANGQRLAGWRYGPVRDDRRRFHDALKPFDALSPAVQAFDRDQVRLIATKIVRVVPDGPPTLFRDHWVGIDAAQISAEALALWLQSGAIADLLARTERGWLTLVSALWPGAQLAMTEALLAALDAAGRRNWRLFVLEPVPEMVLGADTDTVAARHRVIARPETIRIIDLTPPGLRLEDWRNAPARREAGLTQLRGYLAERCDTVLSAPEPAGELPMPVVLSQNTTPPVTGRPDRVGGP